MALVVHHLENSRSQRVLWLLEELGVEYELKRYERDPKTMLAPESLRSIHPLGKSPLLEDEGRVYAESGPILEHLVEEHGGGMLRPDGPGAAMDRYRYWLHYAGGSLMPLLLLQLVFDRLKGGPVPFFLRPIAKGIASTVEGAFIHPQTKLHLDYIEGELGRSAWLCGDDLTAADVQMSFPLEAAVARAGVRPERHPRIVEFVKRCHARPAYQRALERGGPYAYA